MIHREWKKFKTLLDLFSILQWAVTQDAAQNYNTNVRNGLCRQTSSLTQWHQYKNSCIHYIIVIGIQLYGCIALQVIHNNIWYYIIFILLLLPILDRDCLMPLGWRISWGFIKRVSGRDFHGTLLEKMYSRLEKEIAWSVLRTLHTAHFCASAVIFGNNTETLLLRHGEAHQLGWAFWRS